MKVVELRDVVRQALSRRSNGVAVIAVDGPSGSGKSTLAGRLAASSKRVGLSADIVAMDEFLSWPDPVGATWWDRFEDQVLQPLFAGRPLRYQTRDWDGDEFGLALGAWRRVAVSDVVIIEGVGSARSSVRSRAALSMWIETDAGTRLDRGIARDGESHRQLWMDWMQREAEHFAADRTRENAIYRIDGAPDEEHDPDTHIVVVD